MYCWEEKLEEWLDNQTGLIGTWGYSSGSGSGASAVPITGTVLGIRLRADAATTFNINGGNTVSMVKNEIWWDNPTVPLVDPTINFLTGTWQYYVERVT